MARTAERYKKAEKKQEPLQRVMVGVYARLSVDRDEKKSESIDTQITLIQNYIQKQNSEENRESEFIVYDIYSDLGKTGTNFERSEFERMMRDIRCGNINCVMVKDFSRFGRNYIEAGNYLEKIFPFLNVRLISVCDHYDSASANAGSKELSMNIKNLVNDMYAKDISKKMRVSKRTSQKRGDYVGSMTPYGYQCILENDKHRLVVDEETAAIVKWIFESYVAGMSLRTITEDLFQRKVHRPSDYRKYQHLFCEEGELLHEWGNSTLRSVLTRNNYYGDLVQRKYQSKFLQGEKWCEMLGESEWIVAEDAHEPIISKELFLEAQKRIKESKEKRNDKGWDESERAFYNVCYCGDCGRKMATCKSKGCVEYFCQAHRYKDDRHCDAKYISENKLQLIVREELTRLFQLQGIRLKDMTTLTHKVFQEKIAELECEERRLDSKWNEYSKSVADAYMKYKEDFLSKDEYMSVQKNRTEFKRFMEERKSALDKEIKKMKKGEKEEAKFLRSLIKMKNSRRLNQELVESLVERVNVLEQGKIEIIFRWKGVI